MSNRRRPAELRSDSLFPHQILTSVPTEFPPVEAGGDFRDGIGQVRRRSTWTAKAIPILAVVIALAGCSTYAAQRYSIAPTNIVGLRAFRGQQVNVGPFTAIKPGRSEITCRAVGPIKTPDGEPIEEFIRKAFIADLSLAEVYSTAAPITLTGRLDAIDFSSGLTDAAWDIAMTFSSSNGKSLSADNHYSFSGNFIGEVACNQTAQALMPAVQDLIGKIIVHPDFAGLLR